MEPKLRYHRRPSLAPRLRINRVLRVMLHTRWSAEACFYVLDLLRNQQLRRNLKGLVVARGHIGRPRECRVRVALVGFDHECHAEADERAAPGSKGIASIPTSA